MISKLLTGLLVLLVCYTAHGMEETPVLSLNNIESLSNISSMAKALLEQNSSENGSAVVSTQIPKLTTYAALRFIIFKNLLAATDEQGYLLLKRGTKNTNADKKLQDLNGAVPADVTEIIRDTAYQLAQAAYLNSLGSTADLDLSLYPCKQIPQGLKKMPYLHELNLQNSPLTSLAGLGQRPDIQTLYLGNNQLKSLDSLEHLPNLMCLSAIYNQLTSPISLKKLTNLTSLYLGNNQLISLEGIDQLVHLRRLHLENNQLTSLEDLKKLRKLEVIVLRNNPLKSLEGIDYSLPRISSLFICLSENQRHLAENAPLPERVYVQIHD